MGERRARVRHDGVLRLIAAFKFLKAALLVAAGLGALELVRPGMASRAHAWAVAMGSSELPIVREAIARVSGFTHLHLVELGFGAFAYASLFAVEGTGLWLGKRWAEYLTVIATASLVPFELYELAQRGTLPRASALALNLVVVAYLVVRLRRTRGEHGDVVG